MEKRVFRKDSFGELKILAENAGRNDLVEFCDKEIEKIENRKPSQSRARIAKQEENEKIKEVMLEILDGITEPISIADFIKTDDRMVKYTSSKISALMRLLVKDGKVKTVEGKKVKNYIKVRDIED